MIQINDSISIPESDIQIDFVQASGPGGQNVNKVASQAQLRFNLQTHSLPDDIRARLIELAGKRIKDGETLIIQARRYRTQEQNRQDALDRLVELIRKAAIPPRVRRKTRPTLTSRLERLAEKRRHSTAKHLRQRVEDE